MSKKNKTKPMVAVSLAAIAAANMAVGCVNPFTYDVTKDGSLDSNVTEKIKAGSVDRDKDITRGSGYRTETVTANLNSDGSVKNATSNVTINNTGAYGYLMDNTTLQNISSVVDFTNASSVYTFTADGEDISYSGDVSDVSKLPITASAKYYLNGKEVDVSELNGATGTLTAKIKYSNSSDAIFNVIQTMRISKDSISDIQISNGEIIENPTSVSVVGYSTLGIGANEQELTISAKVTDLDIKSFSSSITPYSVGNYASMAGVQKVSEENKADTSVSKDAVKDISDTKDFTALEKSLNTLSSVEDEGNSIIQSASANVAKSITNTDMAYASLNTEVATVDESVAKGIVDVTTETKEKLSDLSMDTQEAITNIEEDSNKRLSDTAKDINNNISDVADSTKESFSKLIEETENTKTALSESGDAAIKDLSEHIQDSSTTLNNLVEEEKVVLSDTVNDATKTNADLVKELTDNTLEGHSQLLNSFQMRISDIAEENIKKLDDLSETSLASISNTDTIKEKITDVLNESKQLTSDINDSGVLAQSLATDQANELETSGDILSSTKDLFYYMSLGDSSLSGLSTNLQNKIIKLKKKLSSAEVQKLKTDAEDAEKTAANFKNIASTVEANPTSKDVVTTAFDDAQALHDGYYTKMTLIDSSDAQTALKYYNYMVKVSQDYNNLLANGMADEQATGLALLENAIYVYCDKGADIFENATKVDAALYDAYCDLYNDVAKDDDSGNSIVSLTGDINDAVDDTFDVISDIEGSADELTENLSDSKEKAERLVSDIADAEDSANAHSDSIDDATQSVDDQKDINDAIDSKVNVIITTTQETDEETAESIDELKEDTITAKEAIGGGIDDAANQITSDVTAAINKGSDLALTEISKNSDILKNDVETTLTNTIDSATKNLNGISDDLSTASGDAAAKLSDLSDKTTDSLSDVADKNKADLSNFSDKTEESLDNLSDNVKEASKNLSLDNAQSFKELRDTLNENYTSVKLGLYNDYSYLINSGSKLSSDFDVAQADVETDTASLGDITIKTVKTITKNSQILQDSALEEELSEIFGENIVIDNSYTNYTSFSGVGNKNSEVSFVYNFCN